MAYQATVTSSQTGDPCPNSIIRIQAIEIRPNQARFNAEAYATAEKMLSNKGCLGCLEFKFTPEQATELYLYWQTYMAQYVKQKEVPGYINGELVNFSQASIIDDPVLEVIEPPVEE